MIYKALKECFKPCRCGLFLLLIGGLNLTSCSTTKSIPQNEQLFVGISKINYEKNEDVKHFITIQDEIEEALATQPNGALFGSSSLRSPFPIGLWIWNAFSTKKSGFSKWITKSFGKKPVLISNVNPSLRALVAKQILRSHGYLRGEADYNIETTKNKKQAKIAYKVIPGPLFRIDSVAFVGFPEREMNYLKSLKGAILLHKGDVFDISILEEQRERIYKTFRYKGLYYYKQDYTTFLADTISVPGKVLTKVQLVDSLPKGTLDSWRIGKALLAIKTSPEEQLTDSMTYSHYKVFFNGNKPRVRPKVILRELRLFPGQKYDDSNYTESLNRLSSLGIFNSVDINFAPLDTTNKYKTMDMLIQTVLDKPYDFFIETNVKGKTTGRLGPAVVLGFAKRNAFRRGEIVEFNLHGNYEWQTGHSSEGTTTGFNSYSYGGDLSLRIPKLLFPLVKQHKLYRPPTSIIKMSSDIVNRAGYFKRHIVSGELTFNWQTSVKSSFEFSPLIVQFDYMTKSTQKFKDVVSKSTYLQYTMQDKFIPKMYFAYTYNSPSFFQNPIRWQLAFSEAGNLVSLGYLTGGYRWNSKEKKMFKNPYAQFLKAETDFTKIWKFNEKSSLVGHINAGCIWSYGNSSMAPYSEQFYVGGANSVRAFNIRTIGPGAYHVDQSQTSYLDQTGDIKFLANLEYRRHLVSNFYGALFLDAGNVWALKEDYRTNSTFKIKNVFKQMALGTGLGIRYDMQFLVIRVDWGVALHTPYSSGFYNIKSFKEGQNVNFAIGYPF